MALWIDPDVPQDETLLSDLWSGAPDDPTLTVVLEAAQDQCADYAPVLLADAPVPSRYKIALIMQARAIYRSMLAGAGEQIGPDGMTVTVWPMDRTVKKLLRPTKPRSAT